MNIQNLQKTNGFKEILEDLGLREALATGQVKLQESGSGYKLSRLADGILVAADGPQSLLRALSLIKWFDKDSLQTEYTEAFSLDHLGAMLDVSRNAVPRPTTVKRFLRQLAVMGYTRLYLYMEDTFEIPGYPYFGHQRGRYSADELSALDSYAADLGIELVPCIQTLAHLGRFLLYSHNDKLIDTDDILLIGEPKVYEFLEAMAKSLRSTFSSQIVNIGMDEAYKVGLGEYLRRNGYHDRFELLSTHLKKVVEIFEREDFRCQMWSDMFFRLADPSGDYAAEKLPEGIGEKIPAGLDLVYWDYFSKEESFYERKMNQHKTLKDGAQIVFAGGVWTWSGQALNYSKTFETTIPALSAVRKAGIRQVMATLWGDDAAETHFMQALAGLFVFAEFAWGQEVRDPFEQDRQRLSERFDSAFGANFSDFLALDRIDNMLGLRSNPPGFNTGKQIFYQDPLYALFDSHIPEFDAAPHYATLEKDFIAASKKGKVGKLFPQMAALSNVLALKTKLSKRIRAAYEANDKKALRTCLADIKNLGKRYKRMHRESASLWLDDFKPEGWEIIDMRFGALEARLQTSYDRIDAYLRGNIAKIEELELPVLPYVDPLPHAGTVQIRMSYWHRLVSANYISHLVM